MPQRMVCAQCGKEMNHHADKLEDPRCAEDAAKLDSALGGVVEEMHTCPDCGRCEMRCAS